MGTPPKRLNPLRQMRTGEQYPTFYRAERGNGGNVEYVICGFGISHTRGNGDKQCLKILLLVVIGAT